jgi:hypothetical protein
MRAAPRAERRAQVVPGSTGPFRRIGLLGVWAGCVGAATGLALLAVPAQVPPDVYSFPVSDGWFTVTQLLFCLQHLALLPALWALRDRALGGPGRLPRTGACVAVAGMTLLALMELAAISAADDATPSARTDAIDTGFGIASVLVGAGAVAAGLGVARHGTALGRLRLLPLGIGVYVFVPLTPAVFGPHAVARLAISGWMLLFALLGWALLRVTTRGQVAADTTSPSRRPR